MVESAYLVTLVMHKALNSLGLIFILFILYFLTEYSILSEKLVWHNTQVICYKIFQEASNLFRNVWDAVSEKRFYKSVS